MGTIELFGKMFSTFQVILLALLSVFLLVAICILIWLIIKLIKQRKFLKEIEKYGPEMDQEDEQDELDNPDEVLPNQEVGPNLIVGLKDIEEVTKTACPRKVNLRLRLNNATDNLKSRYSKLRNYLETYKIREQFLLHRDNYFIMKENIQVAEDGSVSNKCKAFKLAMITIRRKTLILSLNILRELTNEEQNDNMLIDVRRYRAYNYNMAVSTASDLAKAFKIIEDLFALYSINKKKKHEDYDYVKEFSEDLSTFERRGFGYLLKNEITFEEADSLSDSLSKNAVIINKLSEKPQNNYSCEVSLDTLRDSFNDNDIINIDVLKEKNIVEDRYSKYIVTDGKSLNKRLFIDADGFSSNAIKMISITGGEARVIQRIA